MAGYPVFNSFEAASKHFARCRTFKWWILDKKVSCKQECAYCKKLMDEAPKDHPELTPEHDYWGNRVVYNPKTMENYPMHYLCAWENTLKKVL